MQWLPWQQPKPKLSGLCISTDSLCLVTMTLHQQAWELFDCAYQKLSNYDPIQSLDTLGFLSSQKRQCNKVAIAVDHHNALFKTIELDSTLKDSEIFLHIEAYAEHYFGYSLGELWLDFTKESTKQKNLVKIHCVAIKRSRLENTLSLLKTAGLTPIIIELNSASLLRLFQHTYANYSNIIMIHFTEVSLLLITKNVNGENFVTAKPWNESDSICEFIQKINFDLSKYETILLSTDTLKSEILIKKLIENYKKCYIINPFLNLKINSNVKNKIANYPLHFFSTAMGLSLREIEHEH